MATADPSRPIRARALVDGRPASAGEADAFMARPGVAIGDAALETIGVWGGVPFNIGRHLDRLTRSADVLAMPTPPVADLRDDLRAITDDITGDARVRILLAADGARLVQVDQIPPRDQPRTLLPELAPWIAPRDEWRWSGAKVTSYGLPLAARRRAIAAGGDDALLVSRDGIVLETPTSAVAWLAGGRLHMPAVDLGIVPSTTSAMVATLAEREGIPVDHGAWPLSALTAASEFMVLSSLRPVARVTRVGAVELPGEGAVARLLDDLLWAARGVSRR